MEQRALIASLVLGCVTAAGAGGYLAVRQMAPAPAPETTIATSTPAPDPTEGTVADLGASEPLAQPVNAPEVPEAPRPAVVPTPSPRPTASSPASTPAPRTSATRASTPAPRPSAPAEPATPGRADTAGRAGSPSPATTSAPAPAPSTASRDTWPAPDRWPNEGRTGTAAPATDRDRDASTTTADAPLPSRPAVSEPVEAQAPLRRLENVTIPADAVIGVQLETTVNSDRSRVEDAVKARVTRDVMANGVVVIPAGTRLLGSVTLVEEGGRIKERARLGVRFHTLVFGNGTEVRLPTETIYREGEEVAGRAAAKIGGAAIGGAILGAIMGGGKGAVIGAATGAGSGTGWAMAGDRKPAELRSGQSVTVRVSDTVMTQIER